MNTATLFTFVGSVWENSMDDNYSEWTSCESYGHIYDLDEDGITHYCRDCGDSYTDEEG